MEIVFNRYEYALDDNDIGSYTIKNGVAPLNLKNERLVQVFSATIYPRKEWQKIIDSIKEY